MADFSEPHFTEPRYDNYPHSHTPPPHNMGSAGASEHDDWPQQHEVGSPHSQGSSGSMMDSPISAQSEQHRRSVDMSATDGHQMTISERRQEKRKMKRFRLTHNQTRFLMSEFARQAHPDAAHRERLAREIPGLSPRQVQVWFQNRRAKLKRMSSDDRERMMKSRALPEEFPILQTLQYPRGVLGTPIPSPTDYHIRRHDVGVGLGNGSSVNVSPTTPSYGFSLAGQNSNSEMLSPVSTSADRNGYMTGYMTAPQHQRGNPFSRSHTQTDYRNPGSVPRLQLQEDRYGGHEEYQQHSAGYGLFGSANEPPRSVPPEQGAGYAPVTAPFQPYPSPHHNSPHHTPHTTHLNHRASYPPPLTLSEFKYSTAQHPPLTPHTAGFQQEYSIPQMSAPADTTTFGWRDRGAYGREVGHQRKRSSSHPPPSIAGVARVEGG
ncbi:Similar to Homeobox protein ANF-1; acc. no. P79775 [Pyronema omphalodes CBS 100304]|uniref:Similar to Homeobox protein ANF-1 acc. no. P79775 n=1 Tax=Pyronema omphalodes (strain CBS 100304) TaxID=1076935 RepID=U4LMP4_PYROM|nr:Similar to Homeobox protein ANF-1; acc. no. P79775 [Pyronema omphalodes CBS 100304]